MRAFILGLLLACGLTGAAPAQTQTPAAVNGCVYLSSPITLTNLQRSGFLCDVNGKLLVSGGGGGTGTVTSVGFTGGLISVATPTTTPAFTIAGTSGGIPYFSSASTWASSAALTANALVIGGGAGAAPATTTTGTGVLTALGLSVNGSGAISLTTSPTFVTPALGAASATTLTIGGAAIGADALAVTGSATFSSYIAASNAKMLLNYNLGIALSSDSTYSFSNSGNASTTRDVVLSRKAAASLQLGEADAAAPVAQTLGPQSVVAGTSNTAGATLTIRASAGTGLGNGGSLLFRLAPPGSTGTTQNAYATALTLDASLAATFAATVRTGGYTVGSLPTAGVVGRRAYVTDQLTACVATGAALVGGGAVACPAFDNGSAWVGG